LGCPHEASATEVARRAVQIEVRQQEPKKRGRKPKHESQAAHLLAKLAAWKYTHKSLQPSLRGLARRLGTSHQLLLYHLKELPKWQAKEHLRVAMKVLARASAENRFMTPQEYRQWLFHDTESFKAYLAYEATQNSCKSGKLLLELTAFNKNGK
jgi:hypothetical protein